MIQGGNGGVNRKQRWAAQAVVLKVSKTIGRPLDELHLSMEAFRDAIVFGEPPHGRNFGSRMDGAGALYRAVQNRLDC